MPTEGRTRGLPRNIERLLPPLVLTAISRVLPTGSKDMVKALLLSGAMRWLDVILGREIDRRYKRGKQPTTFAELKAAFQSLPLPNCAVVFVHSSMSRLGYIEGGASTVVNALREVIVGKREGTLAVPTFTMAGGMADTLRAGILFDVQHTPSGTGWITEIVRRQQDARRSLHPTHSVAAVGPRAAWLVDAHHRESGAFGPSSPFGRLVECGGYILGLGIDLGPVTSYHVVEDLSTFPIAVYTPNSPIPATCIDQRGERVELKVMAHDPSASITRIDRPNGEAIRAYLTTVLETAAGLTWHQIGGGRMWLISARRLCECLDRLKDQGITIYATAEEVASFPPAATVLSSAVRG